jgi:hypothetical protein
LQIGRRQEEEEEEEKEEEEEEAARQSLVSLYRFKMCSKEDKDEDDGEQKF